MPACRLPAGRQGRQGRQGKMEYWMKKVRSNPIIPVFQKHNICIKALINNNIISILLSNSRYLVHRIETLLQFCVEKNDSKYPTNISNCMNCQNL